MSYTYGRSPAAVGTVVRKSADQVRDLLRANQALRAELDATNEQIRAEEAVRLERLAQLRKANRSLPATYAPSGELAAAVEALGIPVDLEWQRHRAELLGALS